MGHKGEQFSQGYINSNWCVWFSDLSSLTSNLGLLLLSYVANLASLKEIKVACPSCMIPWLTHEQLNLWFAASACGMKTIIKGSPYLETASEYYMFC